MPLNLHSIAFGVTRAVNGTTSVSLRVSAGYATDAAGKRAPLYAPTLPLIGDVQPASSGDLRQLEGLNIQGIRNVAYLNGNFNGVVRPRIKGGDLLDVMSGPYAGAYLIVANLETWPEWCKVAITLQNGA